MSDYATLHVKRNPQTGEVALRTRFKEADIPHMKWLISHPDFGGRYADAAQCDSWEDLYVPEISDE